MSSSFESGIGSTDGSSFSDDARSPLAGYRGATAGCLLVLALLLAGCAAAGGGAGHAALDAAAASAARELARELSSGVAAEGLLRVAVMPPRAAPPALAEVAHDLRHRLGDHLRELAPGLVLVERDDLEALWREHRLPASGLLDPEAVAELGRMLGADALLLGSLVEVGGVPQLHLRLVDVETAAVLASATRPLEMGRGAAFGRVTRAADRPLDPTTPPEEPSPHPAASRPAAPSLSDRPVVGDFRLALEGCGFVGPQLLCRLTVVNLAPGARALTFLGDTTIHDTRGDDYRLQRVRVGTAIADLESRAASARHVLAGGLEVSVELTFSGVPRRKRKAQLLDLRFAEGRWSFEDIPLGRD